MTWFFCGLPPFDSQRIPLKSYLHYRIAHLVTVDLNRKDYLAKPGQSESLSQEFDWVERGISFSLCMGLELRWCELGDWAMAVGVEKVKIRPIRRGA